jgi:hypothetical protein
MQYTFRMTMSDLPEGHHGNESLRRHFCGFEPARRGYRSRLSSEAQSDHRAELAFRQRLPSFQLREDFVASVIVISGEFRFGSVERIAL